MELGKQPDRRIDDQVQIGQLALQQATFEAVVDEQQEQYAKQAQQRFIEEGGMEKLQRRQVGELGQPVLGVDWDAPRGARREPIQLLVKIVAPTTDGLAEQ